MNRTRLKNALLLLGLLLTPGCAPNFFKVVSSSYAKELCSCLFVVGQDQNYCQEYAKQIVSPSSVTIDHPNKSVQAKGFGHTTVATYRSQRLGCSLENKEI